MSQVQASMEKESHISAVATVDCEGKKYRFVTFFQATPTGAQDRLAFKISDADDVPDGILNNQPKIKDAGDIVSENRIIVELGGTVSAFDEVGPDANGKAVTYGEGHGYVKVLKGGEDGDLVDGIWLDRRPNAGKVEANDLGDTLDRDAVLHKISISAGADTATLPNGRYVGQPKRLHCTVDGGGSYAVSGTFKTNATAQATATFDTVGDALDVIWDGSAWFILNNSGVVMA